MTFKIIMIVVLSLLIVGAGAAAWYVDNGGSKGDSDVKSDKKEQ
ncbi:MAG: hypothetical protein VZR00_08510 [Lachnospiraceae bacterium]|jgi:hypothetical protein|nr:hypothetical protein [Lachnospiraceae bacterium]MEE3461910.1 hypothetical protein [Lachnospiraceae bacterium]